MVGLPKRRLDIRLNDAVLHRYAAVLSQPNCGVILGTFRHLNDVTVLRA